MGANTQPDPGNDTRTTNEKTTSEPAKLGDALKKRFSLTELSPEKEAQVNHDAEQWERERLQRQRRQMLEDFLSAVGPRFRDATLENFELLTDAHRVVMESLKAYAANLRDEIHQGNGIVLFGPVGTGKDGLLVGLAKLAIERYGLPVTWQYGLDLYGEIRDRMDDHRSEAGLIRRLTDPQILILSDPAPPEGSLKEFQAGMLLRIVDKRYRECRPTWITLNVQGGSEADERMALRLSID